MTSQSRAGGVFLICFGLLFAGAGLFFAGGMLFGAPAHVQGNRWVGALAGMAFVLVGAGIVYAAIVGLRKQTESVKAETNSPSAPWLWRKDWAVRRAESRNRNRASFLWLAAIFWNLIALPAAALQLPKLWRTLNPIAFLPLLFCLVGAGLVVAAIRASIRRNRFGQTYFEFASLPFSPGQTLKGTIHLRFNSEARHGIDLSLKCVRQITSGSGNNRATTETILWQSDNNASRESLMPSPMGDAAIPVEFSIPSDAYESCYDQPDDKVLWILHAQADVPGVNFSDDFEVPVFRLATSLAAAASPPAFPQPASAPAFQSDDSDVAAPSNPKVVVSMGQNAGAQFYFPAFRNLSRVLVLLLFTLIWSGIVYFLWHSHAPRFFAVVFSFFELPLLYGLLQSMLGSSRIEVGNGKIVSRRALLGIGSSREIPFSNISQILPVTTAQQKGARPSYSLRLVTKDGKKLTLVDAIDDRQEARWVAAQLVKSAGLKLDTHVATDSPFAYGPPPQRGQISNRRFRRNSPAAIAVGLAVFCAWTGFVGYQIVSARHRQPKRAPKPAASAPSPLRPAAYATLTDDEVTHLQALPDQQQAEELLDRAVKHDPRALDLFEQNISHWHIARTPEIDELEQRSRFSTDLRVRYANADLNLAIYGLPKTQDSVDQLIAMAQNDPGHRAYAVYAMGMLAGRGVGYDRIYPVLLDYAKNDADPQVRQWAVEGMRYLGTEDALDQLFDSFTHDPSNAVRDRAGCNLSDCGNFMRKQRMKMVPKLIDLAADPQATPQMRSWTFMALREITGQMIPANASMWQDWYAQHGAEKMAEFERQDWWQVRGDQ